MAKIRNGRSQIETMTSLDQVPAPATPIVVAGPKVINSFGVGARAFAILQGMP